MKPSSLRAILLLTLGWFGNDMAASLDCTRFPFLLSREVHNAAIIGLILCIGPLAGITIQPLMGWYGDKLAERGISRRLQLMLSLGLAFGSLLVFLLPLSLWMLIGAITLFYTGFNLVAVNYRALISETSNRRALAAHKGTVSGAMSLFSSLGCSIMFAMASFWGQGVMPVIVGAAMQLSAFLLFFHFAPRPKKETHLIPVPDPVEKAEPPRLSGPWHLFFYAMPWMSLLPGLERKMALQPYQKSIFRLFTVIFTMWLGIAAMRGFFGLFALKGLHADAAQANLPYAVLTGMCMLCALPMGKLADRVDNRKLFAASLLMYMLVAASGFFWVKTLPGAIAMTAMMGLALSGMNVLPLSMLLRWCPAHSQGAYLGLFNLFISMPQLYSLMVTGWLVDMFHDYRVILAVAATCVGAGCLLTLRMADHLKTPAPEVVYLEDWRRDESAAAGQV